MLLLKETGTYGAKPWPGKADLQLRFKFNFRPMYRLEKVAPGHRLINIRHLSHSKNQMLNKLFKVLEEEGIS